MGRIKGRKIPKNEKRVEEINSMVHAARMYYEDGCSQVEIAKRMKLNQTKVSKLLNKALENHVVQISISPKYAPIPELQEKIKKRFPHIDYMHISFLQKNSDGDDLIRILGYEGAKYFADNVLKNGSKIGFSCGRNLESMVSFIDKVAIERHISLPKNTEIYALVHPCLDKIVSLTPSAIVASAVRQLKGIGYAYQFPTAHENVKKYGVSNYKKHSHIERMLKNLEDLDIYFIGIGGKIESVSSEIQKKGAGLQFNRLVTDIELVDTLQKLGAVGECLHQPFDAEGKFLLSDYSKNKDTANKKLNELKEHILFLELTKLRNMVENKKKPIIAISGGTDKHTSVFAALKAKIFNGLITDSTTALEITNLIDAEK